MADLVNHDIHLHSRLSSCSSDPEMTAEYIVRFAAASGYDTVCITDHVWDSKVPGASSWYLPQDIAHSKENLPLPKADGLRVLFGCETEYCGGDKLGLSREGFDEYDFVVVPVNHFHMVDFTRPRHIDTPEAIADLLVTRLEELLSLDLPFEKIGLAHLTCGLLYQGGDVADVLRRIDGDRLSAAFARCARAGCGVELNAFDFKNGAWRGAGSPYLPFYRRAVDAGCRLYFSSDAHHPAELEMRDILRPVAEALGLGEEQLFRVPNR